MSEDESKNNEQLKQEFQELTGITVSQFKMLVEAVTTKVYEQLINQGYVLPNDIYDGLIAKAQEGDRYIQTPS